MITVSIWLATLVLVISLLLMGGIAYFIYLLYIKRKQQMTLWGIVIKTLKKARPKQAKLYENFYATILDLDEKEIRHSVKEALYYEHAFYEYIISVCHAPQSTKILSFDDQINAFINQLMKFDATKLRVKEIEDFEIFVPITWYTDNLQLTLNCKLYSPEQFELAKTWEQYNTNNQMLKHLFFAAEPTPEQVDDYCLKIQIKQCLPTLSKQIIRFNLEPDTVALLIWPSHQHVFEKNEKENSSSPTEATTASQTIEQQIPEREHEIEEQNNQLSDQQTEIKDIDQTEDSVHQQAENIEPTTDEDDAAHADKHEELTDDETNPNLTTPDNQDDDPIQNIDNQEQTEDETNPNLSTPDNQDDDPIQNIDNQEQRDDETNPNLSTPDNQDDSLIQNIDNQEQTEDETNPNLTTPDNQDDDPIQNIDNQEQTEDETNPNLTTPDNQDDDPIQNIDNQEQTEDEINLDLSTPENQDDSLIQNIDNQEQTEDETNLDLSTPENQDDSLIQDIDNQEQTEDETNLNLSTPENQDDPTQDINDITVDTAENTTSSTTAQIEMDVEKTSTTILSDDLIDFTDCKNSEDRMSAIEQQTNHAIKQLGAAVGLLNKIYRTYTSVFSPDSMASTHTIDEIEAAVGIAYSPPPEPNFDVTDPLECSALYEKFCKDVELNRMEKAANILFSEYKTMKLNTPCDVEHLSLAEIDEQMYQLKNAKPKAPQEQSHPTNSETDVSNITTGSDQAIPADDESIAQLVDLTGCTTPEERMKAIQTQLKKTKKDLAYANGLLNKIYRKYMSVFSSGMTMTTTHSIQEIEEAVGIEFTPPPEPDLNLESPDECVALYEKYFKDKELERFIQTANKLFAEYKTIKLNTQHAVENLSLHDIDEQLHDI